MTYYRSPISNNRHRRMSRRLLLVGLVLVVALVAGSIFVHRNYRDDLQPVSDDTTTTFVTVASGTPPSDIAQLLHDKGLIRSTDAFQWYVTSHNVRDKLQAGTYRFSPSMSTPTIVKKLVSGEIATDLVTILPGQTLTEIRQTFIKAGFKVNQVDAALRTKTYADHPALADNPKGATLEGFLYPDSYQKNASTDPQEIIESALDEMQAHLTTKIRDGFAKQGLSVFQGVTLASVVEKEVAKQNDRNQVAQVFLKRLRKGIKLQSDVTVFYAKEVGDNRFDTTEHKGLPVGPIATVSDGTLSAVASPANTSWLYFVSGDNGTTYFSKTFEEHQKLVDKYCHKLCN